jgi:hypothetical protein
MKSVVIRNLAVDIEKSKYGDEYYFDEREASALVDSLNAFFSERNLARKYLAVLEEV